MSLFVLNRAKDILPKYMQMGSWKAKLIKKLGRASRTGSKRPTIYTAVPPVGGWTGGHPKDNGCKGA